jgi:hypothetical protein
MCEHTWKDIKIKKLKTSELGYNVILQNDSKRVPESQSLKLSMV